MKNLTLEQKIALAEKLKAGKQATKKLASIENELKAIKALYTAERDPELAKEIMKSFDRVFEKLLKITDNLPTEFKITNWPEQKEFPKEIEISNLPSGVNVLNFPQPPKKMVVESKDIKEVVEHTGLMVRLLDGFKKAVLIIKGEVKITNKTPDEAVPVVLTDANRRFFYNALQQFVAGSGGPGETKILNKSGSLINPGTEETLQDILTALGGTSENTPYIYNESMADKSTVYNKALPDNTKQVTIKLRDIGASLKIGWTPGFTTYMTIMPGASKSLTAVNLVGKTIYFQADDDNQVAEIEVIV